MGNYKIKVKVDIVECDDQDERAVEEKNDGSFSMIINEKDGISIDDSEKALLSTAYPAIRKAMATHLETLSKKKSLKQSKNKK
jgi:hypothetical protein